MRASRRTVHSRFLLVLFLDVVVVNQCSRPLYLRIITPRPGALALLGLPPVLSDPIELVVAHQTADARPGGNSAKV